MEDLRLLFTTEKGGLMKIVSKTYNFKENSCDVTIEIPEKHQITSVKIKVFQIDHSGRPMIVDFKYYGKYDDQYDDCTISDVTGNGLQFIGHTFPLSTSCKLQIYVFHAKLCTDKNRHKTMNHNLKCSRKQLVAVFNVTVI
ncbi:hypothetical protein [Trichoplusia ni ascovirus 2c]|uniref:hypothetical protein n=1 Tax=Trichoplusia ni ascovirus 2c TaxID=328615 RepID=UPI0000E4425B|nr:hypothetical protein TNAV2c_gp131 [Trichoplusia ni ascovirus 2c]ABF70648.1 hypothetical protein [Trichoplusia ni ascovirus 2c]